MSQGNPPVPPFTPSNMPPYSYPDPVALPQPTSNVPAVLSLIFGIIGCVPFITSIVAVILGIVGLRKTRDPRVGGKGLAIAGLVLGCVGVLGWASTSVALYAGYSSTAPARATVRQFVQHVGATDATAAKTDCIASITDAEIDQLIKTTSAWGTPGDVTCTSFEVKAFTGTSTTCVLSGWAKFSDGNNHVFNATLVKNNGTYLIQSFSFQ